MKADYMSSDKESTDLEIKRQTFVQHVAAWQSLEFKDFVTSLDWKIFCDCTERSKSMVIPIVDGEPSEQVPDECPEWAMTIFS